ncbi:hypothetical protein ES707_20758 [subsurface metagenome]
MIKILLRINGRGNACQEILDETQLEKWITQEAAKKIFQPGLLCQK